MKKSTVSEGYYRAREVLLPKVVTTLPNEPLVEQGCPIGVSTHVANEFFSYSAHWD